MNKRRDVDGKEYDTDAVTRGKIPRRIVLDKDRLLNEMLHVGIDITGMPNANTMAPVILLVQEKCNLGDWHTVNRIEVAPWGND